jgi:hypothetical protein
MLTENKTELKLNDTDVQRIKDIISGTDNPNEMKDIAVNLVEQFIRD